MLKVKKLRCEYKENPIGLGVLVPRLSWQIQSGLRGVLQTAYQIQVAKSDDSFKDGSIVWETGKINSDESVHIEYTGAPLESETRYYYRIRVWDNNVNASEWSETAFWEMGLLKNEEWIAEWITPGLDADPSKPQPCPYLRKEFNVSGRIKRARIYITALGLYQLELNGLKVGNDYFTPGWTSYNKRLQYQAYDVTGMVSDKENAIGVILGDGWYKGDIGCQRRRNVYGDKGAVLVQLHLEYEDGRTGIILSDTDWKASTGPILCSEIYDGEAYDARLEMKGWSSARYDDSAWSGVSIYKYPKTHIIAQENMPVRIIDRLKPAGFVKTPEGDLVLDMGQNMVGWIQFRVTGNEGRVVMLQHFEVLDKDGNVYIANLESAKQLIEYTMSGTGQEVFEPHFTFMGFRYVKLEGFDYLPSPDDFTGMVLHSDLEITGSFKCSDENINQLQHNILWSQKGNFMDIPTDCPQRNERLGWTGDAQLYSRTACFNMNAAPFYSKWLKDLAADQTKEHGVSFFIPDISQGEYRFARWDYPSSVWGDAATITPWNIYLCYGDKRILEEQYESMKDWVEYIRSRGDNEFLWNTGFHFGDWLALDGKENSHFGATPTDFISTAFYAYSTRLLAVTAKKLGKDEDSLIYNDLYNKIVENFRKEFITPNGRLISPTQTAHVIALMFDLVEQKDRKRIIDTLAQNLEERNCHLQTGLVGTPYLCHVLSNNGLNDISYKLLFQKDFPSWLYQITKGATTIWEHWDGIKEDGSFFNPAMNSFNHYVYGAIGEWLYRVAAGIDTDPEKPGYKHIYIRPRPGKGLDFVEAVLQCMYGEIRSSWKVNENGMEIEIAIPANTTATVVLPYASLDGLSEGGKSIASVEGVKKSEQMDEGVKLELGSGMYFFLYKVSSYV